MLYYNCPKGQGEKLQEKKIKNLLTKPFKCDIIKAQTKTEESKGGRKKNKKSYLTTGTKHDIMKSQKDKDSPKNQKGFDNMTTNNCFQTFNDAKTAWATARQIYQDAKRETRETLIRELPPREDAVTAAQIAKGTGLDSHDVARMLSNYRCGEKVIEKVYVAFDPDTGEIDMDQRTVRRRRVRTYGKRY